MKQLIYSFFICLLILLLKIKFNLLAIAMLMFFIAILLKKKMIIQLFFALILGLTLQVDLKPIRWNQQISGIVVKRGDFYFITRTLQGKVLVYSNLRPKINSYIKFRAQPTIIKSQSLNFDAKHYWNSKGINYEVKKPQFIKINLEKQNVSYLKSWFNLAFLNEKDKVTRPIYKNFQELGLVHLIIISSFHITFLYALLYFLKKRYRFLIVLLFCIYSGFGPPSQKALLYLILINIFPQKEKSDVLAMTGFLILIISPWSASDLSFIFTIGFSFVILLFYNRQNKLKKIFTLRLIGTYIQWMFTSSIYLLNFFSILLSPVIFMIYLAIFTRQVWFLKLIEIIFIKLNKINIPVVTGSTNITIILISFLVIWLIKQFNVIHKSIKQVTITITAVLFLTKLYLSTLSFVTFLNVEQGDSALIKIKNKAYLIDVGKPGSINKIIKPYLFKHGISQIDNIYISHNHIDHIGGMQDNFKGLRVVQSPSPYLKNLNLEKWKNQNDNSQVLLFAFNNKRFLFTGDITKKVEKYIANKITEDIDYLKVAHHGSKTSSDETFITKIYPQMAIISVGKNRYGHPAPEVIARFEKYSIEVKTTKDNGHIKIML